MKRKKQEKMFGGAIFHFTKRESRKYPKGERFSEVTFSARFAVIIGISILTFLIGFVKRC